MSYIEDLQDGDLLPVKRSGRNRQIFKEDFVTEIIRLLGNSYEPLGGGGGSGGSGSGDAFHDTYKFTEGVIRRVNNTTWSILGTSDGHNDINLGSVTVSGSTLLVTWDFGTPSQVIRGTASKDEQYVKLGIDFGTAMNGSNMGIYSYMNTSGGVITCNGSTFAIQTPAFDISDDGGKRNIYDVQWNGTASTVGGIPAYTCRVQFNSFNTDMIFDYIVQSMSTTYPITKTGFGTAGSARGYVDVQFTDWAGNVQTTLSSAMKFSVISTQRAPVNISKLVDANSNIWVSGIVKV